MTMRPQRHLFGILRLYGSNITQPTRCSRIHSLSRTPRPSIQRLVPSPSSLRSLARPESTASTPAPSLTSSSPGSDKTEISQRPEEPAYQLTFTCKPCSTPSTHRITKHGYHKGTVLITCPNCKNRHIISDHLRIFADEDMTLEDILKKKGESIQKGQLAGDGDIELWDDGTSTYKISPGTKSGSPRMY